MARKLYKIGKEKKTVSAVKQIVYNMKAERPQKFLPSETSRAVNYAINKTYKDMGTQKNKADSYYIRLETSNGGHIILDYLEAQSLEKSKKNVDSFLFKEVYPDIVNNERKHKDTPTVFSSDGNPIYIDNITVVYNFNSL